MDATPRGLMTDDACRRVGKFGPTAVPDTAWPNLGEFIGAIFWKSRIHPSSDEPPISSTSIECGSARQQTQAPRPRRRAQGHHGSSMPRRL